MFLPSRELWRTLNHQLLHDLGGPAGRGSGTRAGRGRPFKLTSADLGEIAIQRLDPVNGGRHFAARIICGGECLHLHFPAAPVRNPDQRNKVAVARSDHQDHRLRCGANDLGSLATSSVSTAFSLRSGPRSCTVTAKPCRAAASHTLSFFGGRDPTRIAASIDRPSAKDDSRPPKSTRHDGSHGSLSVGSVFHTFFTAAEYFCPRQRRSSCPPQERIDPCLWFRPS